MQDDIGSSYVRVRLEGLDERELWDVAARLVDDCGSKLGDVILARIKRLREARDHAEMGRWLHMVDLMQTFYVQATKRLTKKRERPGHRSTTVRAIAAKRVSGRGRSHRR